MSTIKGKVVLKETGVGIGDLLVVVYDLDGRAASGEPLDPAALDASDDAVRMGSTITDAYGEFTFSFPDDDAHGRERPDYRLFVLAPEEDGVEPVQTVLFRAGSTRRDAGTEESYLVRLTEDDLEAASVPIPHRSVDRTDAVVATLARSSESAATIDTEVRSLKQQELADVQARHETFAADLRPRIRETLHTVPEAVRTAQPVDEEFAGYVSPGDDIAPVQDEFVGRAVDAANETTQRGQFGLTADQLDALSPFRNDDGDFVDVPAETLDPLLGGDGDGTGEAGQSTLFRSDPIARLCREPTAGEECLDQQGLPEDDAGAGAVDDADDLPEDTVDTPDAIGMDDIPRYVAPLIDPGEATNDGSIGAAVAGGPATRQDVQQTVDSFLLESGPADVPAFHDFHHVQIALDSVWQEAIDEGILDLTEDAYTEIVDLGGDPCAEDPFEVITGAVVDFVECMDAELADLESVYLSEPPADVIAAFDITIEQWNALTQAQQSLLEEHAIRLREDEAADAGIFPLPLSDVERRRLRSEGERMIRYAETTAVAGSGRFDRLHEVLAELKQRVREDYPFTVFAANRQERSINFGLVTTYRQEWTPVSYQVGELVSTTTLAPNEVRKFSKTTTTKTKRSDREVEKYLLSKEEEATETSRYEAEILRKADRKTNFDISTEGTFDIKLAKGKSTTSVGGDAASTSSDVKKNFREAVVESAQEFKDERTVEVETEEVFDEEVTESWEVENQNQELSLTALYYELQRRYRLRERIHRLTPVVFVAQELPAPHEIDDDWLIANAPALKRFALDDAIEPALDYLASSVVGDEVALKELRRNVQQQRRVVDDLKEELVVAREQVAVRTLAFERALEERAGIVGGADGLVEDAERLGTAIVTGDVTETVEAVGDFFGFGGGADEGEREAARLRQEAARDAMERATDAERKLLARLEREVTSLNDLTERYTEALSEHLNRRTQIAQVQTHVKQNILWYMQGIWSLEPHGQRFFRLHKVQVPVLDGAKSYTVMGDAPSSRVFHPATPGFETHGFTVTTDIDSDFETQDLADVADIGELLGFSGNYMIFPLRESNALVDFMMQPYVDMSFGEFLSLHDPDEFGNLTLEEFSEYVCCLAREDPDLLDDEAFRERLRAQFERLVRSPLRDDEEIVVPSDSLYMELLPGSHSNLEPFKLRHRAMDVEQVAADVRATKLENVRAAARLLGAETDSSLLEDPDVERKIVVEGDVDDVSVSTGDGDQ